MLHVKCLLGPLSPVTVQLLLGGGELKGLQYPGLHGLHQGDSVGHHVIPLRVVPGGFSAGFTVSHRLVTPGKN